MTNMKEIMRPANHFVMFIRIYVLVKIE